MGQIQKNTRMENALIYLLKTFRYKAYTTGKLSLSDSNMVSDRVLIFEKKDI